MERTTLGLGIIGTALVLGLLGDGLLRALPWGINVFIWVVALVGAGVALAYAERVRPDREARWLALLAVLFAALVAWRAAPMLVFLNILVVLVALSLAALWMRPGEASAGGVAKYLLGGLCSGLWTGAGPVPLLARDVEWDELTRSRWQHAALVVMRGLLIAAPLVFIFGGLFAAADAVFEGFVRDVFDFDMAEVFGHLFLIGLLAWITAGLLRFAFLGSEPAWTSFGRPDRLSLGIAEVAIVIGLLDVLFLGFIAIQVRYLFGGVDVAAAAGLTYAEYARRGFFELVAVTALVLPLLLLAHWLFRAENRIWARAFVALAGSLLVLLFAVMVSALYRMWLYLEAFGLTELRFYATAFMVWLAVILLWFVGTVLLRDRRDRFASGLLAAGFAAVLILNAVNPDAIIARVNIGRMEEGKRFDPYYLISLSADAAPVLVEALPEIGDKHLEPDYPMKRAILERWNTDRTGWRTWNYSRFRARNLVENFDMTAAPNRRTAETNSL